MKLIKILTQTVKTTTPIAPRKTLIAEGTEEELKKVKVENFKLLRKVGYNYNPYTGVYTYPGHRVELIIEEG